MPDSVLHQLSARDRALLLRCALAQEAPRRARLFWLGITHLGGTGPSLLAAGLPLLACCRLHEAAKLALLSLVISHVVVQLIKRTVVRARPGAVERASALVSPPDRFSLPSGHSAASMSVALSYALFSPSWAALLLLLAFLVGFSRVRLRVHYPSDVIVGQTIAALTVAAVSVAL
jgi:undecaprenyl-diphosphatase